jgi:hypothetical protein
VPTTHKLVSFIRFQALSTNAQPLWVDEINVEAPLLQDVGTITDIRDAVSASGSITAVNNTAGFSVAINNDWRTLVEFRVTLGGAGTINVQVSFNGTDYYTVWSYSLSAAGTYVDWDLCAAPYFRINVPTTGIDVAIDIRAIKL